MMGRESSLPDPRVTLEAQVEIPPVPSTAEARVPKQPRLDNAAYQRGRSIVVVRTVH
jgi:hypothetical protein